MRSASVAVALTVFASVPVLAQTIEGVWKPVVAVIDSGANRGRHNTDVQPGLLIFTQRHYSMLFVQGFAPRPQLSDSATDAERGRVFGPFTANSGTYQRTDSTITFRPTVAKVPAVMAGTPFTLRARAKGDTLWVGGGPGVPPRQETAWVRVERR